MSKIERDPVLNHRPGKESELPLRPGEVVASVGAAIKLRATPIRRRRQIT